jgi:hypothetical protein
MRREALPVVLEFGFALVVIVGAAVLFTNAVEILGGRLRLEQGRSGACSRPWGPRCRRP